MTKGVKWTPEQYQAFLARTGQMESSESCGSAKGKIRKPSEPNKTEAEFGRMLEARIQKGEFIRAVYEGIALSWCGMRYTPDWTAITPEGRFICFEIKGAHIRDRDLVRFKGARYQWPEITFQLWQKKKSQWIQLA